MLPDNIIKIIKKYQPNNQSISLELNNNLTGIKSCLEKLNEQIAEQTKTFMLDRNTHGNAKELFEDSSILCEYISTITNISILSKDSMYNSETSDELIPQYPKEYKDVKLFLCLDSVCPVCGCNMEETSTYYGKVTLKGHLVSNKKLNTYRCPVCHRFFVTEDEISTVNIKESNLKILKDYYDKIPDINIHSIVVLKNTLKCSSQHKIKDIVAKFPSINQKGELIYTDINASYCFDCDRFTILKDDFDKIKENILCKVTDETYTYNSNKNSDDIDTEQRKSILYNYGYNVQTKRNLSEKQRHIILESVIEAKIMDKRAIVDHLNMMIQRLGVRDNCADAVQKWKDDISFVNQYNQGSMNEVIFNEVIKKYVQS